MTGSRHHTQRPLKAETALRVPSSILLLMRKHRNTVKKKKKTQKNTSRESGIYHTNTHHRRRHGEQRDNASKLKSLQGKNKRQRCCFTFLGNRGTEECWIYLGLQAGIPASFPRTWKIKSNTPQRSQVTGFYKLKKYIYTTIYIHNNGTEKVQLRGEAVEQEQTQKLCGCGMCVLVKWTVCSPKGKNWSDVTTELNT